ncbi:hypothetical protein LTR49_021713 [Elasticomyces elasticus]|nr:hypothetical protein LTR49_021713 [Elasticomyces elasticus]
MATTPSRLLSLPREIRDIIYDFALCTHEAHLVDPVYIRAADNGTLDIRYPEPVEPMYPPLDDDDDEDTVNSEPEDEWEDDEGSMASDEWEETMARLKPAALSPNDDHLYDLESEEDGYDSDEPDDDEEDDDDYMTSTRSNKKTYGIIAVTPFSLSLLRVNRQLHEEATPVFYSGTRFLMDVDGGAALKFFDQLPLTNFNCITAVTITGCALMGDDGPSRRAWSGSINQPRHTGPPTMLTPYGSLLANMAKLKHLSLYLPYGGNEDWYCSYAPIEAQMLLIAERIETLSFVFLGEDTVEALQKYKKSQECYERLMGLQDENAAKHEFAMKYQLPEGYDPKLRALTRKWWSRMDEYVKENTAGSRFTWEWGDRDIGFGNDGNVQAVLTFSKLVDDDSDLGGEEVA